MDEGVFLSPLRLLHAQGGHAGGEGAMAAMLLLLLLLLLLQVCDFSRLVKRAFKCPS